MIVTITMNPAIDKTVEIEELVSGGLNRIQRVEYDAGGKGINVSKTICELGGKSLATGFLGGNAGKTIEQVLNQKQIANDFIWVDGETRTNTKVFEKNGKVTELNEAGPAITGEQVNALMNKLDALANENTLFVLAGSIPKSVDQNIYAKIIRCVHARGAKVLLDADGEVFKNALDSVPDLIKPNKEELESYAGIEGEASEETLFLIAEGIQKKGTKTVAVSMGKEGALFLIGEKRFCCPAIPVKAHSTVGAGDAMVAALSYAWNEGFEEEETVKLAMAASAGAVTTIGTKPPSHALVESLKNKCLVRCKAE